MRDQPESDILQAALSCEDGLRLAQLARRWAKMKAAPPSFRIAFISGGSAETYVPQLRLLCAARGFDFEPLIGTFAGFSQDILDPHSKLHEFKPHLVLLHPTPSDASPVSWPVMERQILAQRAHSEGERFLQLCKTLHDRNGCQVILANFESPWEDPLLGLPPETPSPTLYLQLVNEFLAVNAPPFVRVLDVHSLVYRFGSDRWHDARLWHHAKQPISFDGIVLFARKFAGLVAGLRGSGFKCVVLDLDNTLWGGIVGDEGIEGIRLGEGSAEGEAYKAFQVYLQGLRQRGLLLAVCSKNDETVARKAFMDHPEMVLKMDHISCFIANWDPKADNCLRIARELNIFPDSLVFLDDDPAEREMVRQFAPQIRVLDMPEDPGLFPVTLERAFLFESPRLTSEDLKRAGYYQAEEGRKQLQEKATDLDAFLQSLEMKAVVSSYRENDIPRITQLFNKSNQFNLCTRRFTEQEIRARAKDPHTLSIQIRLQDRFGDHGLISLLHASSQDRGVLRLENWVMSCRVLKRGVEQLMCNSLVEETRKRGFQTVECDYLPTPKNGLVKGLYHQLGLQKIADLEGGGERWGLDVGTFKPFEVHIQKIEN